MDPPSMALGPHMATADTYTDEGPEGGRVLAGHMVTVKSVSATSTRTGYCGRERGDVGRRGRQ